MKPQSRYYQSHKLAELVHQQKSYRLHVNSIGKIMNKTSQPFLRRSNQLLQLKSRKQQSFNHNQFQKSKSINFGNSMLYTKIYKSTLIKKINQDSSFQNLQEKLQHRDKLIQQTKKENSMKQHSFVLRNHRQNPINKSTLLERTRENFRLANKIIKLQPTYRTNNFQKLHQYTKNIKDRIMKYEAQSATKKGQLYVSHRLKSNGSSSISSISRKQSPDIQKKKNLKFDLTNYLKKNHRLHNVNPQQNKQQYSQFLTQKPLN